MTTIQHAIGPNFSNEVFAANLNGLPISWSATQVQYDETVLTPAQVTSLQTVVANHNPATQPAQTVDGAVASAKTYLSSLGWDADNLQLVASIVPVMTPAQQAAYAANVQAVLSMYQAAAASPATFDPTTYAIPNNPTFFGLATTPTI